DFAMSFRSLDHLTFLRPKDRRRLLSTDDEHLTGLVMELNRLPHYNNRLDAIQLVAAILRGRRRTGTAGQGH
ncbi:MAG TPA: hypothetical protein PL106_12480, partial [Flavobacteriales bacterium]|nr:hypothetical protein [Flavobacteriales bacterium]